MPSLRHCSGGPPRSAIHGRARLSRHPCRDAPCATPAFGLWERGRQINIKIKSRSNGNGNGKINSFASRLPHRSALQLAFHHSTGRALARLQLLILMHRPLERPSAGSAQWATRHGCRVSRARPWRADRGGPTEQDRSEGMPSLSEAPNERGKSPWLLGAFPSDPL